ncbi:hypothetical protein ACTXT7_013202, partial [Hymenolepis weldensis]
INIIYPPHDFASYPARYTVAAVAQCEMTKHGMKLEDSNLHVELYLLSESLKVK